MSATDRPTGEAGHAGGHGHIDQPAYPLQDRAHAPAAPLSAQGLSLHRQFTAALDDNLDLPAALAAVRQVLRAPISGDEKRWLALQADLVLGLDLHLVWQAKRASPPRNRQMEELLAVREQARARGDYAIADALREELRNQGIDVVDEPSLKPRTPVRER